MIAMKSVCLQTYKPTEFIKSSKSLGGGELKEYFLPSNSNSQSEGELTFLINVEILS